MLCRLLYVVLVSGFAASIRVPTEWPKPYTNIHKPYRDASLNLRTFPPRYTSVETAKPARYPSKFGAPKYEAPKASAGYAGGWIPILPNRNTIVKTQYKYPTKEYYTRNDIVRRNNGYKPKKASTLSVRGSSVSIAGEHELPQHIPTRPIYPGEGQWAKRGHKHRPYIRMESPARRAPQREEPQPQPDGYDTFQEQEKNFNRAQDKFNSGFGYETEEPKQYKKYTDSRPYEYEEFQPTSNQFVPTKLYSQVRRTEKEVHVPRGDADDLRLRAVIKDSKIQTVYTEEGFEDGAYDHAGHIKEAESEEGRKRFDNESQKNGGAKYMSYNAGDVADESRYYEVEDDGKSYRTRDNNIQDKYGSSADNRANKNQDVAKKGNNKPWRKAQMVKDTKKSTVKNMENGDMDMEVYSEVKVMTTPSKGNETHKFVKITPKKKRAKPKVPLVHKFAITEQPTEIANSLHLVQKRSAPEDYVGGNNGNANGSDKKYPYYKLNDVKSLDRNSALRYSEDLANIPNKKPGDMSFYNSRSNVECSEVDDSVDPIPDHIKNADEDGAESTTSSNNAGGKRLEGLGDKIDCFKAKYFGENPLDSPLFREEKIQLTVPEEFKHDLKSKPENFVKPTSASVKDEEEYDEEDDEMEYEDSTDKAQIKITTQPPTETIKKSPENIYDQIDAANEAELVNRLPSDEITEGIQRNAKEYVASSNETSLENSETQTVSVGSLHENSTGDAATALPLMSNRRQSNYIRNPNKPGRIRPLKIPKRRLHHHSEVEYKDDIKPSEQLHVLSDVLRNIQNSTGELIQTPFPHSPIHRSTSKTRNKHRRRRIKVVPSPVYTQQDADLILNTDLNLGEVETDQYTYIRPPLAKLATTTPNYEALLDSFGSETIQAEETKPKTHVKQYPTVFPTVYPTVYKNHKDSAELFDGYLSELQPDAIEPALDGNSVPLDEEIIGLVPPSKLDYRTIVPYGASHYSVLTQNSQPYFVPGMKPPERKPLTYSDYESNNLKRKGFVYHRRHRRSPKEITYTEIRRNNRKPFKFRDAASEDDSGILTQEEIDAEEEEEERTIAARTTTTPRTTTTEGLPTKSFLEYVSELKNAKDYVFYPDPTTTTTEKGATTTSITTQVPISTGEPPKFLQFVAKLKESEGYVFIPDKKPKATTSKPVAKEEVEESDADDEEVVDQGPVQNSRVLPGFSSTTESGSYNADGEYVPKPKSYVISTIDTSKYKTIDRSLMRHSLSSRYNSDKDSISSGEMDTVRTPISRGGSSKSESVELELVEENTNPTTKKAKSVSAASTTPAVPSEEPIAELTTPRNNKRRMWVRTQKRTSTTTVAPDVTTVSSKRRRGRTRIRSTTESTSAGEEQENKRHIVRNRSIKDTAIPLNHKPEYTPIIPRLSSRHLNNIYITPNKISLAAQKRLEDEEYVPETVEVFSPSGFDAPRHGGNYRSLDDELVVKTTTEVPRYTDVVPKPFAFFSDPALPSRINQLKEGNQVLYEDLDGADDEDAEKKKEAFVINVADTDHVSAINAMKSRRFQRPGDVEKKHDLPDAQQKGQPKIVAQRRSSVVPYFIKDPSKRLYYYAID